MKETIEMGEQNKHIPDMPPKPSSLVSICYTSGTGGNARGILTTDANVVANCSPIANFKYGAFAADDTLLSYMPAAHIFERVMEAAILMKGGAIGFFSGNVTLLGDDLFHLRPTKMPCVPALLNRVYSNAMTQINSSLIGRCIFQRALASKKRLLEKQIVCDDTIWDCLIFKKIRNYFGGRMKLMICGSAPCSDEVLLFTRVALGCYVVQGYGCTEATAVVTCSLEGDYEPGHVGPPVSSCKVKLVALSETSNTGIEKAGEICTFGPCVFQSYFKNPEATAKVLDKDGWLHTGDVGMWTDRGTLKIIGRVNSLFKLSHGQFIAPEKIESVYIRSQFVFQIFVYGANQHDYVVAVVVLDFSNLKSALRPILGPKVDNVLTICTHEATMTLITHDMHEKVVAAGLHRIEESKLEQLQRMKRNHSSLKRNQTSLDVFLKKNRVDNCPVENNDSSVAETDENDEINAVDNDETSAVDNDETNAVDTVDVETSDWVPQIFDFATKTCDFAVFFIQANGVSTFGLFNVE
uniref:long-chain-fatty-acid--CoA ligase n=1 Tax=Romanomermis culicivorax TaxID=13658 RepID=A0A915IWN1_ROMCU